MEFRLGELAEKVGGEVRGDPDRSITGIRALPDAGPEHLSVLIRADYRDQARTTGAGALLVPRGRTGSKLAAGIERDLLQVEDPGRALAQLLSLYHPRRRPEPGIHPTAVVDPTATVAESAHVGPYVVIGAGSRVEAQAVVEAHTVVGRGCRVGEGSWLYPHAVLYDGTQLGCRGIVHAGAVLGSDGFGFTWVDGEHRKVPQVGRLVVGDDVEVGANSALDRGTLGDTRVGDGTKIDNLVQVGHNVEVGRAALLCGQAGIAGSSRLGDHVVLAGQAGVADHRTVGEGVQVAAKSAVLSDVEAGTTVAGIPAVPLHQWRRQVVRLSRLDELQRRVKALERRLAAQEAEDGSGTRGGES